MHFVTLVKYTQDGIKNIKDSPKRVESSKKLAKSFGGEFKQFLYTLGRYDLIVISEFPNPESAAKAALIIAGVGAVRTETLIAFPEKDFGTLLNELP